MAKRVQSPSSINTYKQCPRKYFYNYIAKLPTKQSIHTLRGEIVHDVLENFFKIDINSLDKKDYKFGMRSYITALFLKFWKKADKRLVSLGLAHDELEFYLVESLNMLNTFVDNFSRKLEAKMKVLSLEDAFKALAPIAEEEIINPELSVKGYLDAIHKIDDEISILDYKTSKKDEVTPEYLLQLGIYALLYKLKYNVTPKKVILNFLKFGEKSIDVDEKLLNFAETEIKKIHEHTVSDSIADYPKSQSALCKWAKGQCDFYDFCVKDR